MSNDFSVRTQLWTILRTLQWTTDYFKRHDITNSRTSAEVLLAHVLQCRRIDLYLRYDQPLRSEELVFFKKLIKRRAQHEPDAYIIGQREFWSLSFHVTPDVLIPRPETECLVEAALDFIPVDQQMVRVLELGTGTGAISVALAYERPHWYITASDISNSALEIARHNASKLLEQHQINFIQGCWFEPFTEFQHSFDLIISNPPYIVSAQIDTLDPEVRKFEPRTALDGGMDGFQCLRDIICAAHRYLKPNGLLILEIGSNQADGVVVIGHHCNVYSLIDIRKDYSSLDRVAIFR